MSQYTWFVSCSAVAGLAALLTFGNACEFLYKGAIESDGLYCAGPNDCQDGYVCDLEGITPASEGQGSTCVSVDQACAPACANPTPVCRDIMLCETCTVDKECSEDKPFCNGIGSCVECLPDNTGCDEASLCNFDGVCVPRCQDNNDCTDPATPICRDPGDAGYCAQCNVATDCSPGEICTLAGNCEACTEHTQCESGICDELNGPGRCLTADKIVYVDNQELGAEDMEGCGTDTNQPCQTIAYAVGQATTQGRTWIHVDAGTYTGAVIISGGQPLRIVGEPGPGPDPAVVLELDVSATAVLDVQGASTDVYMDGLAVNGSTFAGNSVNCVTGKLRMYRSHVIEGTGHGVSVSGCELVAERTLVRDSRGIGISITNAPFTLRNVVIINNYGRGIRQIGALEPQGVLEFSTIVGNNQGNGGLQCDMPMPMISVSHIILSNGATAANNEVGGCFPIGTMEDDYSFIRGRNDINGLAEDGYHLTAESAAVNAGMVPAPAGITEDFDGEPRPNGTIDIGADEYHPASAR